MRYHREFTIEELGKLQSVCLVVNVWYSFDSGRNGNYYEPPEPLQIEIEEIEVASYSGDSVFMLRSDEHQTFKFLDLIARKIIESNDKYETEIQENHYDDYEGDNYAD